MVAGKRSYTDVASFVVMGCALILTGIVVKREVWPRHTTDVPFRTFASAPELALAGHVLGNNSAPVTIVEFADFECEYCAQAARALAAIRAKTGDSVRVVYRHLPLEGLHLHAREAALAAECAAAEGRFEPYHDLLYRIQDSIGSMSWWEIARRAGVGDSIRFMQCVAQERYAGVVERDLAVARLFHIRITPTLVIGNRLFEGLPPADELERQVRRELRSRQ
jgi:protein-disulfide isomerase